MTEQEAREKILDIITELCGVDTAREDPDVDLVESGLLDSLAQIELFFALEEAGIVLQPTQIDRNLLRTAVGIETLIRQATDGRLKDEK